MRWRVLLIGSLLLNVAFAVVLLFSHRRLENQLARVTEDLRPPGLGQKNQPAPTDHRQFFASRGPKPADQLTATDRLPTGGSHITNTPDAAKAGANPHSLLVQVAGTETAAPPLGGLSSGAPIIRFDAQPGSKVTIAGTSSIHDWEMNGSVIGGQLEADARFPDMGAEQANASAIVPVRTLKSYAKKMDEVMQEAMELTKFPRIEYQLFQLTPRTNDLARFEFDAVGALTVHGRTVTNTMPVTIEKLDGGKLKITGTTALKMTDFGVPPPCPALAMGMIKTGDDIAVSFEWLVAPRVGTQ
jgi:polyisoprenoid-binding protein YceI